MARHELELSLGKIDVSRLHSEADVRREAEILLAWVIRKTGESMAEKMWAALQAEFHYTPGLRNKDRFTSGIAAGFREDLGEAGVEGVKEAIVTELRRLKGWPGHPKQESSGHGQ